MSNFVSDFTSLLRTFNIQGHLSREVKVMILKQIFEKLNHKSAEKYIESQPNFKNVIKRRCLTLIKKDTYSFISQIIYKYFSDDVELMTTTLKLRNYIRHKKRYEKRRRCATTVLLQTNICTDVIPLVTEFL